MATKKPTAEPRVTNGRLDPDSVTLTREEYAAFMAREEAFAEHVAEHARATNEVHDMAVLLDQQAKRLTEADGIITRLQRVVGIQRELVDMLRDPKKVASLEDLSDFWQRWMVYSNRALDWRQTTRAKVADIEPDLFKAWARWVHNAGKVDRTVDGSTRTEVDENRPKTSKEMQEHMIRRLREENFKLSERVRQVEAEKAEIEKTKATVAEEPKKEEKRP